MSSSSLQQIRAQAQAELELRRRKAAEPTISLAQFVRESWSVLEPGTPLLWNWHIEVMCWHIQETLLDWLKHKQDPTYQQRIQNLLINVPPGSLKSRVVSVCAPAWFWTICPEWRVIYLSANPRVALRDSVYCRDLIESDWYQKRFRPDWKLRDDNNAKSLYWNTKNGFRSSFGFNSRITGDRADAIFWDDPHDAHEVASDQIRQHVLNRWDSAIRNRVNDPRSSVRVGIMQRLHVEDLSGHVLKQGGWAHLCIPQEFEQAFPPTPLGWIDPRTKPGELMFEQRFPAEVVAGEKIALGAYGYAGQHQQRPSPMEGGLFKRNWWQFYKHLPTNPRTGEIDFDQIIFSWDCAFKETNKSDYVVGQVWGKKGGNFYLIDQVRDRMDINATLTAVQSLCAKHPRATAKLVEDKANGSAVIDLLKRKIPGLIPIQPEGGKLVRAVAIAPYAESGNIYFPDPEIAPWVHDLIEELAVFPNGANDDQVDALSQAINWLYKQQIVWAVSEGEFSY